MFKFLKKKFSVVLDFPALIEKMSNILKLDNVAEKTEQLLSFKQALIDEYNKQREAVHIRTMLSVLAAGLLTVAVIGLLPAVAPAAMITYLTASLIGAFTVAIFSDKASNKVEVIRDKINKEVTALVDSHPQEVVNSPKFQQSIKNGFNYSAKTEEKLAKLTADAAQKKAAALSKN
ncbi:MAG: hypothetical protein K8R48_02325 [Alphaproteobacteria bacterium]|nr:hypothetical protein [Alphaproteobacteria bacterium]